MDELEMWIQSITDAGIDVVEDSEMPEHITGLYLSQPGQQPVIICKKRTNNHMKCILAEEYGHHMFCCGNGATNNVLARKSEIRGRAWAYRTLVPFQKLAEASKQGLRNRYELAEYLEVTEEFLCDAINYYINKYGERVKYKDTCIFLSRLD